MGFILLPIALAFLLACIGICVLGGWLTGKITHSAWRGCIAFFVCLGLLFGHDIYTGAKFNGLCMNAGTHVYETVKVKGLYRDLSHDTYGLSFNRSAENYLKYGYEYIEAKEFSKNDHQDVTGILYKFYFDSDGNLIKEETTSLISEYQYGYYKDYHITPYIYETRVTVEQINSGKILGMRNYFFTRGGWLTNWFFHDLLGTKNPLGSSVCSGGHVNDLLSRTLPPETTSLEVSK